LKVLSTDTNFLNFFTGKFSFSYTEIKFRKIGLPDEYIQNEKLVKLEEVYEEACSKRTSTLYSSQDDLSSILCTEDPKDVNNLADESEEILSTSI